MPASRHAVAGVSLSEVLAAMSSALDLTEGHETGHTVRTCIMGMRLADELALPEFDRVALYGALLLKDSGSGGNSDRLAEALEDPRQKPERFGIGRLLRRTPEDPSADRTARADRGERIALDLGFSRATALAIRGIDERWDGKGGPDGLAGHNIPLASRIVLIAQTVDIWYSRRGLAAAMRIVREKSGTWFDPRLARIVRSWREDTSWWQMMRGPDAVAIALAKEPTQHVRYVDDRGLDDVALAFAGIIDAKSPFTYRHSTNVAKFSRAIANELGFEKRDIRILNRAALLHDVGKMGVSSFILDKAGPLTSAERIEMERHPVFTWEILQRVGAFAEFARTAALHHEKLDGSGYPWGLKGDQLSIPARVLCAADMYEALTADRPYRGGLSREAALRIICQGDGEQVCSEVAEALAEATRHLKLHAN